MYKHNSVVSFITRIITSLKLFYYSLITKIPLNNSILAMKSLSLTIWSFCLTKTIFLPLYYIRNENVWQDGFLFDFLQKKTLDL